MSGLPDDFDERKRREISDHTIVPPSVKLNELQEVFSNFNSDKEGFNPSTVAEKLGIKLDTTPAKIKAKQLGLPELQLGQRERVEEHKVTNFMLFNKPLYSPEVSIRIAVVCPQELDLAPAKDIMRSTCRSLGLQHEMLQFSVRYSEGRGALKGIEQIVLKQSEGA
jgi:hypothetical protein